VFSTPESFNNRLGISKSINEDLNSSHEIAVFEMGTYGFGEIREMCAWVKPHISVITGIAPVHLERMKSLENIKFDQYTVKIDDSETDKRIKEIAKNQPNFKDVSPGTKAKKGDLVSIDYKATVEGKDFKGSEGKNTQLTLGKDLFLKGFDKQLIGVKKDDEKTVEAILPENFPETVDMLTPPFSIKSPFIMLINPPPLPEWFHSFF